MTEKSFAATPPFNSPLIKGGRRGVYDAILDVHEIMQSTIENCIIAYGRILLKLKDFEGVHVSAYKINWSR